MMNLFKTQITKILCKYNGVIVPFSLFVLLMRQASAWSYHIRFRKLSHFPFEISFPMISILCNLIVLDAITDLKTQQKRDWYSLPHYFSTEMPFKKYIQVRILNENRHYQLYSILKRHQYGRFGDQLQVLHQNEQIARVKNAIIRIVYRNTCPQSKVRTNFTMKVTVIYQRRNKSECACSTIIHRTIFYSILFKAY